MSDADNDQQDVNKDADEDVQEDQDVEPDQDVQKADDTQDDVYTVGDAEMDVDLDKFAEVDDVQELQAQLKKEREHRRRREYIEKASESYPSLPGTDESKGVLLKDLADQLDEDTYEDVTEVFDRVEKVLAEADLFKSFGTSDTEDDSVDLKKEARKIASERDIPLSRAMREARREHPEAIQ